MSRHRPYPPTPFYDRLTELSKLKDGWLDGCGKSPTSEAITSASVLGAALPRNVTLHVYPTEAGGIALEWKDQHGGHEIEVLPDGHLFLMTMERVTEAQAENERLRERLRLLTDEKVAYVTGPTTELLCEEINRLKAEVAAARGFAGEMREFCSPHGVADGYADRLVEVMDRAKEKA